MENFTPYSALAGGLLIGLAASLLLLLNGRIAGISGILFGLLAPAQGEIAWRVLFIVGLVAGTVAYRGIDPADIISIEASWPLLIIGGLLVGFGTRVGGGCTSGHGICGIGRLSPRGLTATPVFMLSAGVTLYVVRHVVGG